MYKVPAETEEFLRDFLRGALSNAQRLAGDAIALFERGSYPSAQFLALPAMEEMAKIQKIRRPFIVIREKADLDAALAGLEEKLAEGRETQKTWFEAASYMVVEDPKEWAHIVDMVSRMVRTWGRDALLEKRLESLAVDADVAEKKVSRPDRAVTRENAYYFICAAQEMIVDYGDKAIDPYPPGGREPVRDLRSLEVGGPGLAGFYAETRDPVRSGLPVV
ncbi:MAG: AbiV family abortive infection protein [Nitrospinota bacterium]|jgi:AbiV family abortive infection protein|nr:AbiV family abortive infection protein [Nitrospinota bacterium]HJM41895.1 AbiV family abortive infection protein [Nitrospinota bacterium]